MLGTISGLLLCVCVVPVYKTMYYQQNHPETQIQWCRKQIYGSDNEIIILISTKFCSILCVLSPQTPNCLIYALSEQWREVLGPHPGVPRDQMVPGNDSRAHAPALKLCTHWAASCLKQRHIHTRIHIRRHLQSFYNKTQQFSIMTQIYLNQGPDIWVQS